MNPAEHRSSEGGFISRCLSKHTDVAIWRGVAPIEEATKQEAIVGDMDGSWSLLQINDYSVVSAMGSKIPGTPTRVFLPILFPAVEPLMRISIAVPIVQ
jgi:hypothetical protein